MPQWLATTGREIWDGDWDRDWDGDWDGDWVSIAYLVCGGREVGEGDEEEVVLHRVQ